LVVKDVTDSVVEPSMQPTDAFRAHCARLLGAASVAWLDKPLVFEDAKHEGGEPAARTETLLARLWRLSGGDTGLLFALTGADLPDPPIPRLLQRSLLSGAVFLLTVAACSCC
jgi:hypothetical protein